MLKIKRAQCEFDAALRAMFTKETRQTMITKEARQCIRQTIERYLIKRVLEEYAREAGICDSAGIPAFVDEFLKKHGYPYQHKVDEETGTTVEEQNELRSRWLLVERGMEKAHPEFVTPIYRHRGKRIIVPLPVLIQVYYPGSPGKFCSCYYRVMPEFYPLLFGEPYIEGEAPVNACPHVGHFVELEEVIQF